MDANHSTVVAYGEAVIADSATGTIYFNPINESGVYGSVSATVATGTLSASDLNIIRFTKQVVLGLDADEVTTTTTSANKTLKVDWTAELNTTAKVAYRIYKGTATGEYFGYFASTTNTFSDDGTKVIKHDSMIRKSNIMFVSSIFEPAKEIHTKDLINIISKVNIRMSSGDDCTIDLLRVTNQPTWNLGTSNATETAKSDIEIWL
jgi:hypothetical protein